MNTRTFIALAFASSMLVGCDSPLDEETADTGSSTPAGNSPPVIQQSTFEVTYDLQTDRTLLINVEGTATATDSDGSIATYQWDLLTSQDITLSGANTATVSFQTPAASSEDLNDVIIELTITDDDGASTSLNAFNMDINNYLAVYVADSEVTAGTTASVSADVFGRPSLLATLEWSVTSGQSIDLLDANTSTVSFVVPEPGDDNVIVLRLDYTDTSGNVRSEEASLTIVN